MRQRLVHRLGVVVAVIVCLVGRGTPARAQGLRCLGDLRICFTRAAFSGNFWGGWIAGLDCEVDFLDCVRDGLLGRGSTARADRRVIACPR